MSHPDDEVMDTRKGPRADAGGGPPRREPVFNLPPSVLAVIGLCAGIYLLQAYVLTPGQEAGLVRYGAFFPVIYTGRYGFDVWAFTSPLTYTFLHGGFAHVAVNMIWLAAFGSPLANRLGSVRFLVFFAVTGVASAFFFFAVHPFTEAPLVGASGAISGMMGAAARFAFHIDRASGKAAFAGEPLPFGAVLRSRTAMTFLGVWMVINIVTGVVGFVPGSTDQIAWEAHIGGLLAGFFGLRFFDRRGGAKTP